MAKPRKRVNTKPKGKNIGYVRKDARSDAKKDPYLAKAEAIGETKMAMADNTMRTVQALEEGKRKFMQDVFSRNGPPPVDSGKFKRYLPNA
jgi:hypothetical protein